MQTTPAPPYLPPAPQQEPRSAKPSNKAWIAVLAGLVLATTLGGLLLGSRSSLGRARTDLSIAKHDLAVAKQELGDTTSDLQRVEEDLAEKAAALTQAEQDLADNGEVLDAAISCSYGAMAAWYGTIHDSYSETGLALDRIVHSRFCRAARFAYKSDPLSDAA